MVGFQELLCYFFPVDKFSRDKYKTTVLYLVYLYFAMDVTTREKCEVSMRKVKVDLKIMILDTVMKALGLNPCRMDEELRYMQMVTVLRDSLCTGLNLAMVHIILTLAISMKAASITTRVTAGENSHTKMVTFMKGNGSWGCLKAMENSSGRMEKAMKVSTDREGDTVLVSIISRTEVYIKEIGQAVYKKVKE